MGAIHGMKLLFVHEMAGAFGGAETNLHLTARELGARGHKPALLHRPPSGQAENAWREIFPERFVFKRADQTATVEGVLKTFAPDLIYVHKMADLEVMEALIASGLPVVRMVHDHDLYCMRSYKYHPLTRAVCRRPASLYCVFGCGASLRRNRGSGFPIQWMSYTAKQKEIRLNQRCHRMIVATDYMRRELLQNGFHADKIEIHPPVTESALGKRDATLISGAMPTATGGASSGEGNVILYAGQIIRGKGVDVLLESLARIKVPFQCRILGEGNQRRFCERLARRLGLSDRVRFPGFVPQAELEPHFRAASVMVVSSVWPEPFGGAGLEGMRRGLPVVAFDAGGIREWLVSGYNGYLVRWMDRAQFAARVEELLMNKPLARQLGERGANLVRRRFDFSDYITALEKTFTGVISQARQEVNA